MIPALFKRAPRFSANPPESWSAFELHFSSLPLEDVRTHLADWAGTLIPPALLSIHAGEDGLRVRLFAQKGTADGPIGAWAAITRQHSRWQPIEHALPASGGLSILHTPAVLPDLAPVQGDPFLTIGASLVSLANYQAGPAHLHIAIHGRAEALQEKLRRLFSYATGSEKGVDDDTPNPWALRLRLWRMLMVLGAAIVAIGGAVYAARWISHLIAGAVMISGGLVSLAGFLGTLEWMRLRSQPQEIVYRRMSGALLKVNIFTDLEDPNRLRLLAGEHEWRSTGNDWKDSKRNTFPLPAADILSLIAPLQSSEGVGMLANDCLQRVPAPPPSAALRTAPRLIGTTPSSGTPIGVDPTGHMLVVGGSRTGKSSAVFRLLRERLDDPAHGPGLFLVDPHNSLADAMLHSIDTLPPSRRALAIARLRVITPDPDFVVPLNPLVLDDFNWAGGALILAGRRIWGEFWGPRMQAALLALARLVHAWNRKYPEEGMGLIHTISAAYRLEWREEARRLLPPAQQPGIDALNALLGQRTNSRGRQNPNWVTEVVSPIVSKLMALELSPWLFAALHQNGFVDFESWVHDKNWIVVRLPSGVMGSEAAKLTAGLVYNIFEAAFRKVTSNSVVPFSFVIDEVQEIGRAMALESLLSEGGKFGARMIVLAQSLSLLRQMDGFGSVVQALLANTSTQLFFSPDPDDARIVRETLSLQARYGETTIDVPSLHAWLRARIKGQWQPPTLVQVEPIPKADPVRVKQVIADVFHAHPACYLPLDLQARIPGSLDHSPGVKQPPSTQTDARDARKLGW